MTLEEAGAIVKRANLFDFLDQARLMVVKAPGGLLATEAVLVLLLEATRRARVEFLEKAAAHRPSRPEASTQPAAVLNLTRAREAREAPKR